MTKPAPMEELAPTAGRPRAAIGRVASRSALGGFLAGAAVVGAIWWASAWANPPGIHADDASLRVSYMVETAPGSAEGSAIDEVVDIEFGPAGVIVKRKDGSGGVFFAQRTRSLTWSRQARPDGASTVAH